MRVTPRFFVATLGVIALAALPLVSSGSAFAQAKQAPAKQAPAKQAPAAAPAPAEDPPLKQMALTEAQVQGVISAQKDLDAAAAKMPTNAKPNAAPDPKIAAEFEAAAKKNGFASYAEYNDVVDNISFVLGGFDPQTKKYVGSDEVVKMQIAAVQADKKMSAKDRKAAMDELNEALRSPSPPVQNKGNIDLVGKYYDQLSEILSDDD